MSFSYETLNNRQLDAVLHKDGPLLVLAGAGSGKTTVLIARVAKLIESGVRPWNILAITFTNKAADELKNRLVTKLGGSGGRFRLDFPQYVRKDSSPGRGKNRYSEKLHHI